METKEAAKYLGISWQYLRNMRQEQCTDIGPEYVKVKRRRGPTAIYSKESLDKWKEFRILNKVGRK